MIFINKVISFGLIACLSSAVVAEELADTFFPDLPIVTTASRLAESVVDSSSSVTVIDRTMIEASGFVELVDVFRLVPGFQVSHVNGYTFAAVPHGGSGEYPNRLQLLIDGRSTYLSAFSAIDWDTIGVQIQDVERIEIVRGPAPSSYGSNSFAGAINVITRQPQLDDSYYVSARIGNNGDKALLLRHSSQLDNIAYRLTATTSNTDGFDELNDGRRLHSFNAKAIIEIDNNDTVSTSFHYTNGTTDSSLDLFASPERSLNAISTQINWAHILSENEELKLNFSHNFRDENDMALTDKLSDILGVTPEKIMLLFNTPDQRLYLGQRTTHAHRTDLELQYSHIYDSGVQYVVGGGGRYDTLSSEAIFPQLGTLTDVSYRVFGNVKLPINPSLTANMGGLLEKNKSIDLHLSPKFGLNWHFTQNQTIRTSFARAYRMPSLLTQNFDTNTVLNNGLVIDRVYASNPDIRPERIDSYEIGYLGKANLAPISWEIKLYKEQYRDMLGSYADYASPDLITPYVRRVDNLAQFDTYGIEGELSYRPREKDFIRFHFNFADAKGDILASVARPGNPNFLYKDLGRTVPNSTLGLLASRYMGKAQWSIGVYHVADSEWISNGDPVDAYTRIDVSVVKNVTFGNNNVFTLKLGAQNIANSHYNEFEDQTAFEPRYYLTLALTER